MNNGTANAREIIRANLLPVRLPLIPASTVAKLVENWIPQSE